MSLLFRWTLRKVFSNVATTTKRVRLTVDALERRDVPTGFGGIEGRVYVDANHDGVCDASDPGLAGAAVEIREGYPGTGVIGTTAGADGSYQLTSVPDNWYDMRYTAGGAVMYWPGGTSAGGVQHIDLPVGAPNARDDAASAHTGSPVTVNVLANDDPGLTVTGNTAPAHGAVSFSGGVATYTPTDPLFTGADSFGYTVADSRGITATATVAVTLTNSPPSTWGAWASAHTGPVTFNTQMMGYDPDGDPLTITIASPPALGSVAVAGGALTYTPPAGWSGTQTFTYTLDDGHGGTTTGTATATITNSPPYAWSSSVSVHAGTPVAVAGLANTSDMDGDLLTLTDIQATYGTAVLTGPGAIIYTPREDWNGTATVSYTVDDGHGGKADVTVTINEANTDPVAEDDTVLMRADETISVITVLDNDTDADGDDFTIDVASDPVYGTIEISGGAITYTKNPGAWESDSFFYTITDGHGGTATATVFIDEAVYVTTPSPLSPDSVNQSINQAVLRGSVQELRDLLVVVAGAGGNPATIQSINNAIVRVQVAFNNQRTTTLTDLFVRNQQPIFNPRNLDYMRYYQRVAVDVINRYNRQIASGTLTPDQIQNRRNDIAVQQNRLDAIADWMRANSVQPYPIQQFFGADGF